MKNKPNNFFAVILLSSLIATIFLSIKPNYSVNALTNTNVVVGVVPSDIETIDDSNKLYVFPEDLEVGDENTIRKYLAYRGETEVDRWIKIIRKESGFNPQSKAPTFWSLCDRAVVVTLWGYQQPANSFIELKDYPNGVWQAKCEDYGANTLRTGYSQGLTHIIEITWEESGCNGSINKWTDQLDCSLKIRNIQGWKAWSTD